MYHRPLRKSTATDILDSLSKPAAEDVAGIVRIGCGGREVEPPAIDGFFSCNCSNGMYKRLRPIDYKRQAPRVIVCTFSFDLLCALRAT